MLGGVDCWRESGGLAESHLSNPHLTRNLGAQRVRAKRSTQAKSWTTLGRLIEGVAGQSLVNIFSLPFKAEDHAVCTYLFLSGFNRVADWPAEKPLYGLGAISPAVRRGRRICKW